MKGLVRIWKYLEGLDRAWKDLKGLERTCKDLKVLGGTWKGMKRLERTWKDLKGLERTWKDLKGPERTWKDLEGLGRTSKNLKNFKELNEVQYLEKCDRQTDRQTEDGVTDKASTREAYASKNLHQKEIFIKYDMSMFFKTWLIQSTFTGCELWLLFIF